MPSHRSRRSPFWPSSGRRLSRRCEVPAFTALAILIAISGCYQAPPEPGVISVAMPNSPNNLDPRYGTDDASARSQELIFTDLLRLDDNTRLSPGLALSWDTTDHRTYRIRLRQGVRFHDGHELTAKDVVSHIHEHSRSGERVAVQGRLSRP